MKTKIFLITFLFLMPLVYSQEEPIYSHCFFNDNYIPCNCVDAAARLKSEGCIQPLPSHALISGLQFIGSNKKGIRKRGLKNSCVAARLITRLDAQNGQVDESSLAATDRSAPQDSQ